MTSEKSNNQEAYWKAISVRNSLISSNTGHSILDGFKPFCSGVSLKDERYIVTASYSARIWEAFKEAKQKTERMDLRLIECLPLNINDVGIQYHIGGNIHESEPVFGVYDVGASQDWKEKFHQSKVELFLRYISNIDLGIQCMTGY